MESDRCSDCGQVTGVEGRCHDCFMRMVRQINEEHNEVAREKGCSRCGEKPENGRYVMGYCVPCATVVHKENCERARAGR